MLSRDIFTRNCIRFDDIVRSAFVFNRWSLDSDGDKTRERERVMKQREISTVLSRKNIIDYNFFFTLSYIIFMTNSLLR